MATKPTSHFHFYAEVRDYERTQALLLDEDSPDTAVVFVHGFGGHPLKTWLNFHGLVDDSDLKSDLWGRADLFFYAYPSISGHIQSSGEELLGFLRGLFPKPRADLLSMNVDLIKALTYLERASTPVRTDHHYKHLILVGHSEGGLIIRQAMLMAAQQDRASRNSVLAPVGTPNLFDARLRLFAPALLGVRLSGPLAAIFYILALDSVASGSRAYADMTNREKLSEIREGTQTFARDWPGSTAFKARVLWGEKDSILTPGQYLCDTPEPEAGGHNHNSVCKPTLRYKRPLEFVGG